MRKSDVLSDIDLKTIIVGLHMWLNSASFSHRRMEKRKIHFGWREDIHTQTRELPYPNKST